MRDVGARIYWDDVKAVFPDKTKAECQKFLSDHVVCIEETMAEAGLQEVKALGSVL